MNSLHIKMTLTLNILNCIILINYILLLLSLLFTLAQLVPIKLLYLKKYDATSHIYPCSTSQNSVQLFGRRVGAGPAKMYIRCVHCTAGLNVIIECTLFTMI
jgi:hypothetical protein